MARAISSFPVPLSPGDEHRGLGDGHFFHQGHDLVHAPGLTHDGDRGRVSPQLLTQEPVLGEQAAHLQSPLDGQEEIAVLKGLGDVVHRPRFHGLHRVFHRAVGGHHDDGQIHRPFL